MHKVCNDNMRRDLIKGAAPDSTYFWFKLRNVMKTKWIATNKTNEEELSLRKLNKKEEKMKRGKKQKKKTRQW